MAYFITDRCTGCGSCKRVCPAGAVYGEKKENHEVRPSSCIECGACGRICPVSAVEDSFGVACKRVKRALWEKPVFDRKGCMACVICLDACPVGCLALTEPDGGDPNGYPMLSDPKACLGCGLCALECPVDAITMAVPQQEPA